MTLPPGGQPYNPAPDVQQSSGEHTSPGKRRGRSPLIIGLIVAAVVLVGGGIAAAVSLTGKTTPSDDQRIESTVRDFYGTLSDKGPSVAVTKACAADRAQYDALPDAQKSASDEGKISIRIVSVDHIAVTGDRATANLVGAMTMPGAEDKTTTATEHLRKEDGTWKVCSADGR
ncbi:hypothetical protein [Nocardia sp. NPDC006630]|uniref:Rv0361 family membrane protein n=1 Tax=Nocardia sp. NPDC006630 TaxID=3157181 RepID=UPI0033B33F0B